MSHDERQVTGDGQPDLCSAEAGLTGLLEACGRAVEGVRATRPPAPR